MKKKLLCIAMSLTLSLQFFAIGNVSAETTNADAKIKNIIFMIPDGGGMTAFNLADAVKQAGGFNEDVFQRTPIEKGPMYAKKYWVGAEQTYSASSKTTDSAAGGTALATGHKTNNGYIGITPDAIPVANLVEAAQYAGKNTGIVVTYEWTNATPATFGAHDISRKNTAPLAEQMVNQGIDVVMGAPAGAYSTYSYCSDEAIEALGYEIMTSNEDLLTVQAGDRLWSKFPNLLAYDTTSANRSEKTPTLKEMTQAAITALNDDNENGFFLMVEGSAVDGGGHDNSGKAQVGEFMAFDTACQVALEFAEGRDDTVVIIAPDHDTGGAYWDAADIDSIVTQIQAGAAEPTGLNWTTTSHTNWDGGVWIYAPEGVSYPEGIDPALAEQAYEEFEATGFKVATTNRIENTDLPQYAAKLMGVDLDEVSKELFVDVTSMGTYDSSTEVFSFSSFNIQVERNNSTATWNGQTVDLNGEVALYVEGKFYVPSRLVSDYMGGVPSGFVDVTDKGAYNADTKIFTFTDYNAYIEDCSNILVFNEKRINMGNETGFYSDGAFFMPAKAMEALKRFSSDEKASINIVADYNMKKLNVSGWINSPNASVLMLINNDNAELSDDMDESAVLYANQLITDYNGDFSFSIPVDAEDVFGNYTFNMNYVESASKTPVSLNFAFSNTVPQLLATDAKGGEIMYMNQLNAGDTLVVTARGFDVDDFLEGAVIVAQYDGDDVLRKTNVFSKTGDSVKVGTELVEDVVIADDISTTKIMYWNKANQVSIFGTLIIPSKE